MMKEDIAYSDMLFLAQFHTDFLTHHFQWLQEEDEIAKNPGFRCRKILVRYYLMRKDLVALLPGSIGTPLEIMVRIWRSCPTRRRKSKSKRVRHSSKRQ
jgi:hypothetical protein